MKECPNCNKKYGDYFQYCLKCNYKLKYMEGTEIIEYPSKPVGSKYTNPQPTITCPYCKSTDTEKISNFSKAISMSLLGVFAIGKTSKQWHCNRCNSDF